VQISNLESTLNVEVIVEIVSGLMLMLSSNHTEIVIVRKVGLVADLL